MILIIDNGTTNTKGFIFDEFLNLIAQSSVSTPTYYPLINHIEQNAEGWWNSSVNVIKKLKGGKIESISTSSQGGTFVLLDKKNQPVRPAITWLDKRGEDFAKKINRKYGKNFFYYKIGRYLEGWSPPSIVLWLKENEPENFERMKRISFVPDYLNFRMTGRFFLDTTSATMSCMFNITQNQWDKDILDIIGITKENLPEIINAGRIGGKLAKSASEILGIEEGIPVVCGGHDQYCASLGAGVKNEGDCVLSCGTAWALVICTKKPLFIPESGWTTGKYVDGKRFGLMGPIGEAGAVIDWVKKTLNIPYDFMNGSFETMVRVEHNFSKGRGEIRNLGFSTKPEEIYFATLKSLVSEVERFLRIVRRKIDIKRIFLVGGGAKEKMLKELLKRTTGIKVILPDIEEAAAKGAAILTRGMI